MPLSEPARAALAEYLECRDRFLPRDTAAARAGCSRRAARAGHLTRQRCGQLLKELAVDSRARPGAAVAACAAPCLRQPSARPRRRSAQRAADARAMPISRRRRSIPMCRASGCAGWSRPRTRWRAARMMRHFLDFERPIAELEGKIDELRHLSTDGEPQHRRRGRPARSAGQPAAAPDLCATDAVAEGSGRAPSRAAALPRLHRRADRRVHAARRRPRLCRGRGGHRRHRPVSRAQRRRARHREGRRHRGAAQAQFRHGAARKAIARRGG